MLPSTDELIATLNFYGLNEIGKQLNSMVKPSKNKENPLIIPAFNDAFSLPSTEFGKILADYVGEERVNAFKQTMLSKEDINKIQFDMSLTEVQNIFGPQRKNLFSDKILAKFKLSDGRFDCSLFKAFLFQLYNIQNGILTILKIDPFITRTLSLETFRNYIIQSIPTFKSLASLETDLSWYKEFYVEIVVSVFSFFNSDIYELKLDATSLFQSNTFSAFVNMDIIPTPGIFSIKSTTSIYNTYVNQNSNEEGLIGKQNLKEIFDFKFSDAFLDRLFEILPTFEGKLDFCAFLNFVIPLKNMQSKQGIGFFFKLVDIDGDGYVSNYDISYFYKSLVDETGFTEINFDRFCSEILDTISAGGKGVTINHLMKMGASTFFLKLIDIKTFMEWENLIG
ncbi:EF hand family protein [Trichomonas vaginalis G3]|uniref:EF hand family protein n=1 Tax=Trichomonas vaginalis (strain ATCC PRA-98 / G3) TaxID=412133 RepID=A2EAQ1_TRIV3|nr:positive regulation of B cell differentiation protein family [Trichomonas vaginalis G3]EAY10254.1 EF hand family protein [Trichomonas vaginalis G3]KAI5487736.1 positive regulation of B cell differentiation protein family [Trichomonas vaginalis G3]|eukprot:XP_001322477.1 EF hand family protein [Trichomonas vaginalis G3]